MAGSADRSRTALLVILAILVWPTSLGGCTTMTVVSGHSMEPTFHTGDLVVARCGTPAVGDIVIYQPPDSTNARWSSTASSPPEAPADG